MAQTKTSRARLPLAVRHAAKVNRNGPIVKPELGQCWDWTAYVDKQTGYGQIGLGARSEGIRNAHVVAWELANGRHVPKGLWVLHKCARRRCVRPSHLYLGTAKQNVQDMLDEGASVWQTNPEAIIKRGENHPRCTSLTLEDMDEICRRYAAGGILQRELAVEYGVVKGTISNIVRHKHFRQRAVL